MDRLGPAHRRRLRQVWRGATWPCLDNIELDLLAGGLLERVRDGSGRESLRLSETGVQGLAAERDRTRFSLSRHEALVARVACEMQRAGRLVWRGLSLRAAVTGDDGAVQWRIAMPDVFSIRRTSLEAGLAPIVHEVKVSRADLLGDLRQAHKRAAYLAVGGECWYVIAEGIAEPDEIPVSCGVLLAREAGGFDVARPAPRRPATLGFSVWMSLAKAGAEPGGDDEAQAWLGEGASGSELEPDGDVDEADRRPDGPVRG